MAGEKLKLRIHNGEIIESVSVPKNIPRGELEGILSERHFDFLYVDCQHDAHNEESLVEFCKMAEELSLPVQARIKHTRDAYLIGTYLDLGPSGVMIPEVKEEITVDEALDAFYYPQKGKRSWGGQNRVGFSDRQGRLEYSNWWNETGFLTLQIESVEAVVNTRFLAKSGVDILGFGENDLMFSIEGDPEFPFRTQDECLRHVLNELQGTNVRVSMCPETEEAREKYLEMGVTIFNERRDQ